MKVHTNETRNKAATELDYLEEAEPAWCTFIIAGRNQNKETWYGQKLKTKNPEKNKESTHQNQTPQDQNQQKLNSREKETSEQ